MKYKEFCNWCNDRFFDGCWGSNEAIICVSTLETIQSNPFWKRNKIWKDNYENFIVNKIIIPTNLKIEEVNNKIKIGG